jgi:hypothetical protein
VGNMVGNGMIQSELFALDLKICNPSYIYICVCVCMCVCVYVCVCVYS